MMKVVFSILILLFLGAGGVVAQDVAYNFDKGTDFSKFQTYEWVSINSPGQAEDVNIRQIRLDIDQELATKGLLKTDSDKADLYVVCQAAVGGASHWVAYGGWNIGPHWGGTSMSLSDTIRPGEANLDVYDPAKKTLIWRGIVSNAVDMKASEDKREKNLQKAIEKLLSNYPPKIK